MKLRNLFIAATLFFSVTANAYNLGINYASSDKVLMKKIIRGDAWQIRPSFLNSFYIIHCVDPLNFNILPVLSKADTEIACDEMSRTLFLYRSQHLTHTWR